MYDVDCLIHSVPLNTLEPCTSSRFIVILSPIYPVVSRVVDYDDSFRLNLLGTACTSSAYPTHFNPLNAELNPICHLRALLRAHPILHISRIRVNYESFLQVLYCVNISHACWAPRSFFSTLLVALTHYISFSSLCSICLKFKI